MKKRYIFHKGKDSWVGRGIVVWTFILGIARLDFKCLKYNYGHVEEWSPNSLGEFHINGCSCRCCFGGQCYSSTTRGKANGVRYAPASEVLYHPERWDYIEFDVPNNLVRTAKPLLRNKVGRKYDVPGVFGFALPWNPQDPFKEYCSELCCWTAWLYQIVTGKLIKRISPRRFAKKLVQAGGVIKPLYI